MITLSSFALIIGVVSYLIGLPLMFHEKPTLAWLKKFTKEDALVRAVGGVTVIICSILVKARWQITLDAEGLIVLMAWIGLVKGLYMTWDAPDYAKKTTHFLTRSNAMLVGIAAIIWGALFTYLAFVIQH